MDRKGFTAIALRGEKEIETMNEKHIRIRLEIKMKRLKQSGKEIVLI